MSGIGQINRTLEKNRSDLLDLGRKLFSCPELGFKEVKSNEILTSFLLEQDIPFETGICRTGIKATVGTGDGVHVALVADMDAIELKDEKGKYPFHSCGHSIQTAVMVYALKLIKESGIAGQLGGKVSFIAAPAEEFIDFEFREKLVEQGEIRYFSGKQNMISQGVFDDVDCVLSMHVNGDSGTLFDISSTLSGFMVKRVVFKGNASHSGVASHLGRNALHGAGLCMSAIAFMKDQFPADAGVQIHPVISNCGGSVNIIPDEVVLESYVRANTLEALLEAGDKFDRCARHSALALSMECEIQNRTGYMPLKQSDKMNEIIHRYMLEICDEERIVKNVISGASGDVGDLGYLLPTVQFGFSAVTGRIHSADFQITDEENAYFNTLSVVLDTVRDLLADRSFKMSRKEYGLRKEYYLKNWLRE